MSDVLSGGEAFREPVKDSCGAVSVISQREGVIRYDLEDILSLTQEIFLSLNFSLAFFT